MTSAQMGRRYVEEARGRTALVRLALERGMWATVVREAQECVELFDERDAARAVDGLEFVAALCQRLLEENQAGHP